jgi:hypothetical protein
MVMSKPFSHSKSLRSPESSIAWNLKYSVFYAMQERLAPIHIHGHVPNEYVQLMTVDR